MKLTEKIAAKKLALVPIALMLAGTQVLDFLVANKKVSTSEAVVIATTVLVIYMIALVRGALFTNEN